MNSAYNPEVMKPLLARTIVALTACGAASAAEDPFLLWDPATPVPAAAEIPAIKGVRFEVVKKREPKKDGYSWLHGAAVAWHKGLLFACWGHNKGSENTPTEVNQGRRSTDGGRSWGPVRMIAPNTKTDGRSHGVFLSHKGRLWLFLGRFGNDEKRRKYARLNTEAFVLSAGGDKWESRGIVAEKFWPCDEPAKMASGSLIMGGMIMPAAGSWARPGVAVSRPGDLTRWDTIPIPTPKAMQGIWGETTVIVEADRIVAVSRGSGRYKNALVSVSRDFGRTWPPVRQSNLPMTTSKPYAGRLSTGQRYLICTTNRDHGGRRAPLTIAVSRPGGKLFCRMFRIRNAACDGPGESTPKARLSYPYAVEHDGKLYVIYSNDGGRGGNRNSAEMAIIPVKSLAVPAAPKPLTPGPPTHGHTGSNVLSVAHGPSVHPGSRTQGRTVFQAVSGPSVF